VAERQDWPEDDPRLKCLKQWIHANQPALREEAAVFGVVVKTIRRYLDYTTFKTVLRDRAPQDYRLGPGVRRAQRTLQIKEINAAHRILTEYVPRAYWDPRHVALAERFIGSPEEGADGRPKHGRSAHVRQVIFRTLRRLLNDKAGYKSGHRDQYVRPDNLDELLSTAQALALTTVIPRVQEYVAEQEARAHASRALVRIHSRIHSPFRRWQRQTVSSRPTKRRRTLYPHPGNWI
jgi:hypothetical protein